MKTLKRVEYLDNDNNWMPAELVEVWPDTEEVTPERQGYCELSTDKPYHLLVAPEYVRPLNTGLTTEENTEMVRGFNAPTATSNGGTGFLRLADGEKAIITILDLPCQYKQHWLDGENKSLICTKEDRGECVICDDPARNKETKYASTRFGVPVYIHTLSTGNGKAEPVGEVRIWEQGARVLKTLQGIFEEQDDPNDWKALALLVKRTGDRQSTAYQIIPASKPYPVPDGTDVPDIEAYYMRKIDKQIAATETGDDDDDDADVFKGE